MPTQKSTARLSKKPPLSPEELKQIDAYWRAANYLTACQLYLLDNPLLERPLCESDLKQTIVGHWGTCPGQNFIYTHLDRVIKRDDLDMIYLSGPGHGGNAMVAQDWLDGRRGRLGHPRDQAHPAHRARERQGEPPPLADARAAHPEGLDRSEGGRRQRNRRQLARPSGAHLHGRG